jgi:SAM-dependent methyltransferase
VSQRVDPDSAVYDASYFAASCGLPYRREQPYWLEFFGRIADRIVEDFAPATVLDAGCAMGFLVESLRDRGVDAYGFDISGYALSRVREDIARFTWQASVVDPLDRDYDLIVCIEVLEHLVSDQLDKAIDNLCGHTQEILFSSTSDDYREATHFNVHPTSYWVAAFARRGFFPDIGYDASFVTPWARRLRFRKEPIWRVLESYERSLALLGREVEQVRDELVQRRRTDEAVTTASPRKQSVLRRLLQRR